jgi:hypothetical protein
MSLDTRTTLAHDLERLRDAWAAADRDPARLNVTVMQRVLPVGELRDRFAWYRDVGVNRVLVDLPTEGRDVLLPLLDTIAPALN